MLQRLAALLYAAIAALNVWLWPTNKYEWMLSEPAAAGTTRCTLPDDRASWFYELFALGPALLPLAIGLVLLARRRTANPWLIAGVALVALWVVRIALYRLGC